MKRLQIILIVLSNITTVTVLSIETMRSAESSSMVAVDGVIAGIIAMGFFALLGLYLTYDAIRDLERDMAINKMISKVDIAYACLPLYSMYPASIAFMIVQYLLYNEAFSNENKAFFIGLIILLMIATFLLGRMMVLRYLKNRPYLKSRKKFRGKSLESGIWVYGELLESGQRNFIQNKEQSSVEVSPITVGKYTGVKDNRGIEIYVGDIIEEVDTSGNSEKRRWRIAEWTNLTFRCYSIGFQDSDYINLLSLDRKLLEVTGNIYDNPELLKGGKNEGTNYK